MNDSMIVKALNRNERLRQHTVAMIGFSMGTVAAWWVMLGYDAVRGSASHWELEMFQTSAWCSVAIVWFPFAIVEVMRRFKVERVMSAAALLSAIVAYDGVVRLLTQRLGSGC